MKFGEACGGLGRRVDNRKDLKDAYAFAISSDKPVIIEAIVDPDELIMPPKISLEQAMNFGIAKARKKLF